MTKKVSIDERQIRKIVRSPQKVELSSDNLSKFAVILLQISHGMYFVVDGISHAQKKLYLCTKIRRLEMYEPVLDFDG